MAFYPWSNPVPLKAGDEIHTIAAHFAGDGYVWRWRTDIPVGAGLFRARFDQSTLYRRPANTAAAKKAAPDHVAGLSEEGRIQRFILQAMDGQTSNAEVARRLTVEFPAALPTSRRPWRARCRVVSDLQLFFTRQSAQMTTLVAELLLAKRQHRIEASGAGGRN